MLGPLAASAAAAEPAAAEGEVEEMEVVEVEEVEEAPPSLEAYPIDRCARAAARLARRPAESGAILEAEDLSPSRWEALHAHWQDAIAEELGRGKRALLSTYDAAYVAALEEERGPIDVDAYARLVVASERGKGEALLAEMGLPEGTMMRIERVWLGKTAGDAGFGKRVRLALRTARDA